MATLLSVAIQRILEPIYECHCDEIQYGWDDSCSCEMDDDEHDGDCEPYYDDYSDTCDDCLLKSDLMERLDKFFYAPDNKHFREDVMTQLQAMDIPNLAVIQIVDVLNQVVDARGKTDKEKI